MQVGVGKRRPKTTSEFRLYSYPLPTISVWFIEAGQTKSLSMDVIVWSPSRFAFHASNATTMAALREQQLKGTVTHKTPF